MDIEAGRKVKEVRLLARAKVNLVLRVLAKRDDGYHEIETVMQSLELFDEVTLQSAASIVVSFERASGFKDELPRPPDLTERAIELFAKRSGRDLRIAARVLKRIPIGAGLGGGSADAAAALLGLSELKGRPMSAEELFALAIQLGSDVPFALQGGTAYAGGRGEKIRALPATAKFWWVIGVPGFSLPTPEVYERADSMGTLSDKESSMDDLKNALRAGDPARLAQLLHNDLEPAAFDVRPELRSLKEEVISAGALGAVMAGSGSAIAALCRDEDQAQKLSSAMADIFRRVDVVPSAMRGAETIH